MTIFLLKYRRLSPRFSWRRRASLALEKPTAPRALIFPKSHKIIGGQLVARQTPTVAVRQGGNQMPDHVYRIIEVAGSSESSIEDAIKNAVSRASRTLRQVGWFEVLQTRGHVEDGKVAHFQVILKVGFTLEDC
jgi:flavin-binding protein dodecin